MDKKEFKIKPIEELEHLLIEARKKLDDLNFKVRQGQLKNVREVRFLKKEIAAILTEIKVKKTNQ